MEGSQFDRPANMGTVEVPRPFLPTPERVSQYLELKTEEVEAQMKSVEGRKALYDELLKHQADIREDHDEFHPELLSTQLDMTGEMLLANERYLQAVQAPEKKNMFRRAWDRVRQFSSDHPYVTTALCAAAVAGSIAAGFYFTGNWELLMASTGLQKIVGAAEAAGEFAPPTPPTSPLPGGGMFEIPPPTSPPDLGTTI